MIRKAELKDLAKILNLLSQVNLVHHNGRPDIFKKGTKYTAKDLEKILNNDDTPVLVYTNANDEVTGYVFCVFIENKNSSLLTDIKTLYVDDLCVDEKQRGKGIGKALFNSAVQLAKDNGCYNLTLNVWACNEDAIKFYERLGLSVQKTYLETIL